MKYRSAVHASLAVHAFAPPFANTRAVFASPHPGFAHGRDAFAFAFAVCLTVASFSNRLVAHACTPAANTPALTALATRLVTLLLTLAAFVAVESLVACPVAAQPVPRTSAKSDSAEAVIRLPEVTVVATRVPVEARTAPGFVIAFDRLQPVGTLADVLARSATVQLRSYGPSGLASLSIRGSTSSQTAVVLDGFQFVNRQLGQVDVGLLPAYLLDRVEIVSGASSALYGSDAVGGTIAVSTKPMSGQGASVTLGAGAYGERSAAVTAANRVGALSVAATGYAAMTEGDFPFVNDALFPARESRRANDHRRDRTGLLLVGYDGSAVRLKGRVLLLNTARGLPGVAGARSAGESQHDRITRATAEARFAVGPAEAVVAALGERSGIRYKNPDLGIDDDGIVTRGALRFSLSPSGRRHATVVGGELEHSRAEHPAILGAAFRSNAAVSASSSLIVGRARVHPALRLDGFDLGGVRRALVASPRLGLSVPVASGSPVVVKASGGRAFRMPSFNDLYWRGAGASGNEALRPERSWSAETGAGWFGSFVVAEVAIFSRWTHNQIAWTTKPDGTWSPVNIGRVRASGMQFRTRAAARLGPARATSELGYTYTHARELLDGERRYLRYIPSHTLSASLRMQAAGFALDLDARGVSARFATTDGTDGLPAHAIVAAGIGLNHQTSLVKIELSVRVENLMDADYEVVMGYPMPPRHARILITTMLK